MNIQSIVITNAIGIALIIVLQICSHLSRQKRSISDQLFTGMLFIVASCCLNESISFLVDGINTVPARILGEFSNTWCYFFNISFSFLWCLYVDYRLYHSKKRLYTTFRPLLILTVILLVIILGNLFGHYLFYFDKDNVYHRKPSAYLFFVLPVAYILSSTVNVFLCRRKHTVDFFPIWAFLTPFLFGCFFQAMIYGVSLAWCSTAIGLTALHMCTQNELVFKDPLTHIFNRLYLNTVLRTGQWNRRNPFSGIMIDVDDFKYINDTFGHSKGDLALCDVASILSDNIPSDAVCIRFAGDEFILLLRTTIQSQMEEVMNCIQNAVTAFNATAVRPFTLSLSMGSGIFRPGQSTQDSFLEEIDKNMYINKSVRHANNTLRDRRHH